MDPAVSRRLADDLATYPADHRVEVLWHGGEPLTVGVDHFSALLEPFEPLRRAGRVRHSLQTNATLISKQWCDTFTRYGIGVGVSLDGPRWADRERRTLSGAESYLRARRGVDLLSAYGHPFTVIAVLTSATIPAIVERAAEYLSFFSSIGAQEVGFNIAETEGHHKADRMSRGAVESFWDAMLDAWRDAGCRPKIRDFAWVMGFAAASLEGRRERPARDLLPTVTWGGDVVVLSPELAGYEDAQYDFVVGNVLDDPLDVILARAQLAPYVREFVDGTAHCRASCRYFDFCLGGEASNRYFEHGDFAANETLFCRNSRQIPFDTVVGLGRKTRSR
jgi:uncharacterized protein